MKYRILLLAILLSASISPQASITTFMDGETCYTRIDVKKEVGQTDPYPSWLPVWLPDWLWDWPITKKVMLYANQKYPCNVVQNHGFISVDKQGNEHSPGVLIEYTLDNGVVFMLNGREDISKNSNGDRTISFYPTLNGEPLDRADTEMEGDFVCFRTKKDDLCVGRNTLLPIYLPD